MAIIKKKSSRKITKKTAKKKIATPKAPRAPRKKKLESMTQEELDKESSIALINQRRAQEQKIALENDIKQGVVIVKDKAVAETVKVIKAYDDAMTRFIDVMPEILHGKSKKDIKDILLAELERAREEYKDYLEGLK